MWEIILFVRTDDVMQVDNQLEMCSTIVIIHFIVVPFCEIQKYFK